MPYPVYLRNSELSSLLECLENIISTCRKFLPKARRAKAIGDFTNWSFKDLSDKILDDFRGYLNKMSGFTATISINTRVIKQLSDKRLIEYDWIQEYDILTELLSEINWAGEQYLYCRAEEVENDFELYCSKITEIQHHATKYFRNARNLMMSGGIDYCVLPTKHRMEGNPQDGTILGMDIPNAKDISPNRREEIKDEARRVAFQSEAWEWTDIGMDDSLFFLFVDHQETPKIKHNERALVTATEILSRVTFKFPISPEGEDIEADPSLIKHHFQQLRVVLDNYSGHGSDVNTIKTLLSGPEFKYSNTIMVIGDNLLNELTETSKTYRLNFNTALPHHPTIEQPIYWSSPIGWGTLKLFLQGSNNLEQMNRQQRYYRYQVPGQVNAEVTNNGAENACIATLFDVSVSGARLLILNNPDDSQAFNIGEKITFIRALCDMEFLQNKDAKIVHRESTIEKTLFIGVKFEEKFRFRELHEFLEHCNVACEAVT